ncbi:MAG: ankyrin repeat domain-containing protein [Proteobacteria bacterium]|nr:ankyrin repeat domain-containing protein [Pseudomonadota bacterium]
MAQNDAAAGSGNASVLGKPAIRRQAVYLRVPYLEQPVSLAAAAAMRAVRTYEPRIHREDLGQVVARDARYRRAAVRAVARYERAADQDYVMAHYNMARSLAEGRGVERNYAMAIEHFLLAARLGNVPALLRLAEFHLAGLGVPEDRVEAQANYYIAASIESKGAARAKALLSTHLDQVQLQQARERARIFRAKMPPLDLILQRNKEQDLLAAAAQGDLALVQELIENAVDANAINALGRTSIIAAAWRGHHHIVQLLITTGVEMDAADNQGRTALFWAAINGYPEIVKTLLEQEALVDVRDDNGFTPLIRAAWNGHEEVVEALIDAKADVNAADDRGVTALQRAEARNERQIAAWLRAAGAR